MWDMRGVVDALRIFFYFWRKYVFNIWRIVRSSNQKSFEAFYLFNTSLRRSSLLGVLWYVIDIISKRYALCWKFKIYIRLVMRNVV